MWTTIDVTYTYRCSFCDRAESFTYTTGDGVLPPIPGIDSLNFNGKNPPWRIIENRIVCPYHEVAITVDSTNLMASIKV